VKKFLFLLLLVLIISLGQNIEYIDSEKHKATNIPFSQATVVNGVVYLSGQIGKINNVVVSGGIKPETEQALTNLKNILDGMGQSIDEIFKCTCILGGIKDWSEMSEAFINFFDKEKIPIRSTFTGSGLAGV
tara:strand:- start:2230 stop:2625 length:396 start_codon:yes stop_codon:yes gene_type:complete